MNFHWWTTFSILLKLKRFHMMYRLLFRWFKKSFKLMIFSKFCKGKNYKIIKILAQFNKLQKSMKLMRRKVRKRKLARTMIAISTIKNQVTISLETKIHWFFRKMFQLFSRLLCLKIVELFKSQEASRVDRLHLLTIY